MNQAQNQTHIAPGCQKAKGVALTSLMLLALLPSQAMAVPVADGSMVALSGTTLATRPELAGLVVEDVLRPFTIRLLGGGQINGTLQDRVVREDISGTLDFYYRIFNAVSSSGGAGNSPNLNDGVIRRYFPLDFTTDVDWRIDGEGSIAPLSAGRGGGGTAVGFDFGFANPIEPGEDSRFFFVRTNATAYDDGGSVQINGGLDLFDLTFVTTFQPVAVPEPATWLLLGSGVIGIAFARRYVAA